MKTLEILMTSPHKLRGYRGLTRQSYNIRLENSQSTDPLNKAPEAYLADYFVSDIPWGLIWGPFILKRPEKLSGAFMTKN
jgi:hypothetical protein